MFNGTSAHVFMSAHFVAAPHCSPGAIWQYAEVAGFSTVGLHGIDPVAQSASFLKLGTTISLILAVRVGYRVVSVIIIIRSVDDSAIRS